MKTYNPIFSLSIFLILTSCTSYRYIDIQVLNPALVKIPKGNLNIVIVDPTKTGMIARDSVLEDANSTLLYEQVTKSFNETLRHKFAESPLFHDVSFLGINRHQFNPKLNIFKDTLRKLINPDNLKTQYANEKYSLAVLEYKFKITVEKVSTFPYGGYQLNNKFQFVLFNLENDEVYDRYQLSRTIYWPKNKIDDEIPLAIADVSNQIAEMYSQRVVPYWMEEERRIMYSHNRMMRKAYKCFCNDDLDQALEIWYRLYNIGTRRLSSRAAFNMALIYEIKDELNSSELWLIKSIEKKVTQSSVKYLNDIRKRKLLCVSLDSQL